MKCSVEKAKTMRHALTSNSMCKMLLTVQAVQEGKSPPLPFPRAQTSTWNKPVPVLKSQSSLLRLCGCRALGAAWALGSIRQVKRWRKRGVFQSVFSMLEVLELSPSELVRLGDALKCSIAEGAGAAAALWPCSPTLELPGLSPPE